MSQSRLESRRFKSSEPLRSRHALLYCIGLTGRPRGKSFVAAKTTATSQQANKPTTTRTATKTATTCSRFQTIHGTAVCPNSLWSLWCKLRQLPGTRTCGSNLILVEPHRAPNLGSHTPHTCPIWKFYFEWIWMSISCMYIQIAGTTNWLSQT